MGDNLKIRPWSSLDKIKITNGPNIKVHTPPKKKAPTDPGLSKI